MAMRLTAPAIGSNPNAALYGAKAVIASKVGSRRFVFLSFYDDKIPFPAHKMKQSDEPWKDNFWWTRIRWWVHDFRMFGLKAALKRHYYIGEPWRRKDEKIFVGKDDLGTTYWLSRRSQGSFNTRIMDPIDNHWFRGSDVHAAPPMWFKWMVGNLAHTPAQMQARGEWGYNARAGRPGPFNIRHEIYSPLNGGTYFNRDPHMSTNPYSLLNPERRALAEAGNSRWTMMKGGASSYPYMGVHNYSDELVEEYYRGQWPFSRVNKSGDADGWSA